MTTPPEDWGPDGAAAADRARWLAASPAARLAWLDRARAFVAATREVRLRGAAPQPPSLTQPVTADGGRRDDR